MNHFRLFATALALILPMEGAIAAKDEKKDNKPPAYDKVNPIKETLSSAYITNSALRAKLFGQYANNENVSQAIARFRPSLIASGNTGYNKVNSRVSQNRTNFVTHPKQGQIQVQQNIFNGGQDITNLWAQESGVKAGEYDLLNTEQTTLQNAANAYMQVYFQTAAVKAYRLNVSYLEEQLKSKNAQLTVGEVTKTDVASSESQLAQGMAQLATAESQLADAKANYLQVVGENPGLLEYPASLSNIPKSKDEVVELALKNNPAILNAVFAAKQAGYNIDSVTGKLLPSVNLQATANRAIDQQRFNKDQANSVQAQLSLNVPIYQQGAEYSGVRQAVDQAAQARYSLEQARKSTVENATKAWDAWVASKEQITDLTTQVKAATIARDNAQKEADVGERSYIDVLTLQSQLITAEVNLEQARRDFILAQYAIYNATGNLTAEKLDLPVTYYDVKDHYQTSKWKVAGFGDKPEILDSKDEQLENAKTD